MSATTFDQAIVSRMMDEAMQYCAEKAGLKTKERAAVALKSGDCCACEYMRHAVAIKVAEYLGSLDDGITAAYSYDPGYAVEVDSIVPGPRKLQPAVSLILRVNRKSAALSSLVASLSAALERELRQVGCASANALCRSIDVVVADEQEVQKRNGYGALIHSVWVQPLEVWRR
jgi:hypothetical protein